MTQDILIVIDLQQDVCDRIYRREELIKQVNERIQSYRLAQKPILFIQHSDSDLKKGSQGWELVDELDNQEADFYLEKTHANSSFQTGLQDLLTSLSVSSIEFAGAQTEFCVNSTIVFAHGLGYKNVMKAGNSSTFDQKWMTAEQTISFYETHLWNHRFLELLV